MHVRHEPDQFGILIEREIALGFPVGFTGRDGFSSINKMFWSHDDEAPFRGCFRQSEPDGGAIGRFLSVRRVMNLELDRYSGWNQLCGIGEPEVQRGTAGC